MRTVFLVSVLAALAACSDSQQTTAPASRSGRTVSGDVVPQGRASVSPDAKPVSGSGGFTTVTTVKSGYFYVPAGSLNSGAVTCPAGTTLIGGGSDLVIAGNYAAPATIVTSRPNGNNGWVVTTSNYMAGATGADYQVYALCAS